MNTAPISPLADSIKEMTDEIQYFTFTPKIPKTILEKCNMKKASDQFADIQQWKYKCAEQAVNEIIQEEKCKMENIKAGQNLMKSIPFIKASEFTHLPADKAEEYINNKHAKWEPSYPKMPCIYVYEWMDGSTSYEKETDGNPARKLIAKIEHYIVTDIPKEPTVAKPSITAKDIDNAIDLLEHFREFVAPI